MDDCYRKVTELNGVHVKMNIREAIAAKQTQLFKVKMAEEMIRKCEGHFISFFSLFPLSLSLFLSLLSSPFRWLLSDYSKPSKIFSFPLFALSIYLYKYILLYV